MQVFRVGASGYRARYGRMRGLIHADGEKVIDHGRSRIEEILADDCVSAVDAAACSDVSRTEADAWASNAREQGFLLGIWSNPEHVFKYPRFQFAPCLTRDNLRELLMVLATRHGFDPVHDDPRGWRRALWLYQPNEELSEASLFAKNLIYDDVVAAALKIAKMPTVARSPADLMAQAPEAVIAFARQLNECA